MKIIPKKYIPAIASFILVFILITAFFASRIFYSIKPGEAGVRWKRLSGTEINHIYQEGLNVIFPWDEMYIYNIRIQELPVNLNVLTKSGLTVKLLLSIRYAPDTKLLGVLHQQIGPNYPKTVILPEIESVLREIIGTMDAEQVYTSGRKVIIEAINNAIEQVAQRFINVDDVLIRKIELPQSVSDAIQFKIKQKHLVQAHKHIVEKEKQEARRKEIEGIGIHNRNQIILKSIKDQNIIKWRGIEALHAFARSNNAKIFVVGYGKDGVPIILNTETK